MIKSVRLAVKRRLDTAASTAGCRPPQPISSEGRRPSDSPTASLARAQALAPFVWLASLRSLAATRGLRPRLSNTVTRSALRRLAPFAWLVRCAHSRRWRRPLRRLRFARLSHALESALALLRLPRVPLGFPTASLTRASHSRPPSLNLRRTSPHPSRRKSTRRPCADRHPPGV